MNSILTRTESAEDAQHLRDYIARLGRVAEHLRTKGKIDLATEADETKHEIQRVLDGTTRTA